jgi:S-DNA-T family DNA segregation ATPase FtsK/SpoIIIE
MAKSHYTFRNFFSELHLRCIEFFGICAFFTALATIVSLISYSPEDPSLNTAIDLDASNLLSTAGSYYSDVMIQFFGTSSYFASIILLSFGYQLMKYHVVSFHRIVTGIASCILASIVFAIYQIKSLSAGITGNFLVKIIKKQIDLSVSMNFWIFTSIITLSLLFCIIWTTRLHISSIKNLVLSLKDLNFWPITSSGNGVMAKEPTIKVSSIPTKIETPHHIRAKDGNFILPPLSLLKEAVSSGERLSDAELKSRSANLVSVLSDFGIKGEIIGVSPGPVVTLYELTPAAGVKSSRVIGLSNDIARYMSAVSARVAVIPGRNALGIELPNLKRQTVYLREILESGVYAKSPAALPIALGKDISGESIVADLAKMPHLLIAGTTGSGKSVGINAMILSLLYRLSPDECKFIMIDPKMLELSVYDDIPHLLTPVVTDPKKAIVALKWAVREMESRYMSMSKLGVRNIEGYNLKLNSLKNSGESVTRRIHTGFDSETGAPIYETQSIQMETLPYIVIIVDEMADLMLVAGKDIEIAVQRLAQMARAAGIHLIMATQRPSVDVITGTIKANFPTRISFQVSSKIDSRTILGEQGAEQLLGQGDMLYMASGGRMIRIHCPFVSDNEVEQVAANLKAQGEPHYITNILDEDESSIDDDSSGELSGDDPLYHEAVSLILREGKASTSFIQRHLKIGYNRAARIIDMMETAGIVSPANHVGKREIIGR